MTEEMLKLEIGRFVGSRIATRIARAQSMRRQAQAMLKRADEEDAKTEWYRREAAAGLTLGGSHARAQVLHDPASGCWGAVEPLAPDLPTQTREALAEIDAWIERSRATTCRPETLKEIRAHLLMIRRHLERARVDLAARLWASPVAEVASLSVDPILAASIGKRVERIGRIGSTDLGRSGDTRRWFAARLHVAIAAAIGDRSADLAFVEWQGAASERPRSTPSRLAGLPGDMLGVLGRGRSRSTPWGATLSAPTSLEATVAGEKILRAVFPVLLQIQDEILRERLAPDPARRALQERADEALDAACARLALKRAYMQVRAALVRGPDDDKMGVELRFDPAPDADRELLQSVVRELAATVAADRQRAEETEP